MHAAMAVAGGSGTACPAGAIEAGPVRIRPEGRR